MLNQKSFKLLAILLALMLVLAACGGGGDETDTTEETDSGDTAADTSTDTEDMATEDMATEDMADGEIVLRIFGGNVGQEKEMTQAVADRFMEANPGITVEVVDTPDFVEDRLGVYLQLFEAQSPEGDVFQIDVIWPGDLAEHFVDLNEYGAADVAGDHFDAIVQNNTVDGKLIAIPCSPMLVCFTIVPTCWKNMATTARPPPGTIWKKWLRPFKTANAPKVIKTSGVMSGRETPMKV